ncbi:peptide chain release factor N(5)-glutamine methyltransferase [Ancrocorticia populi]|uniref:peptide chain release factor N(5)-glutamine methyltransferase n=1 Tax=Ancrocorticia populi TaxID=2175228 RepID=UPI00270743E1|nr:peptide chain release factor N(5)-glutamine methyltransferase [Ancrocorticia sp.]
MLWNDLVIQATGWLAAKGLQSPAADAREIAEVAAGSSLHKASDPTTQQHDRFAEMVVQRGERVPLQHVTGQMYFRYLELASRPGCFIVRPETELVAGDAIDEAAAMVEAAGPDEIIRVADLCTGSGNIALAVATEVPEAYVMGVELSEEALVTARENNARYGNPVALIHGDARTALEGLEGEVSVVVSNPPYVPPTVELSPEVEADPPMALWGGGPDGEDFPKAIIERAAQLLKPGGILVMEHAENQGEGLLDYARASEFEEAHTGCDYTGRPRWLWAKKEAE